jgi:hypothetical protein
MSTSPFKSDDVVQLPIFDHRVQSISCARIPGQHIPFVRRVRIDGMRAAAIAVLVVLVGCSSLALGPDAGGETVTPAPVPADDGLPPGVDQSGTVDASVLAAAHGDLLEDASYTLTTNRTVRSANGSLRSTLDVELELSAVRNYYANVTVAGPAAPVVIGEPPTRAEYWSDDEVYLRRQAIDNRTVYSRYNGSEAYVGTWRFWLGSVALDIDPETDLYTTLRSFETRVADRSDGRVHLVGTAVSSRAFVDDQDDVATVENATLHAFVGDDGLVASYHVVYDAVRGDGETVRVRRSVRFDTVGNTTVDRPAWYDEAMRWG